MAPERKRVTTRPTVDKYERWDRERRKRTLSEESAYDDEAKPRPMTQFIEQCVDAALKQFDAVDDLLVDGVDTVERDHLRAENERLRNELAQAQKNADIRGKYLLASGQNAVIDVVEGSYYEDDRDDGVTFDEINEFLKATTDNRAPRLIEAMIDDGFLEERDGRYYRGETQL